MLIKNRKDKNYTEIVESVYPMLLREFKYFSRITDIWTLLARSFGLEKFELVDTRFFQNGEFESYLIDNLISWNRGEDVNFTDISDAIKLVGEFTGKERLMFDHGDIDERLWAIYMLLGIDRPELDEINK